MNMLVQSYFIILYFLSINSHLHKSKEAAWQFFFPFPYPPDSQPAAVLKAKIKYTFYFLKQILNKFKLQLSLFIEIIFKVINL